MQINKNILQDRKIAILTADGFDEAQLFSSKNAVESAGAKVVIVSLKKGQIKAWEKGQWSTSIDVDQTIGNSSADEFDNLIIPGGDMYSDILLPDQGVSNFVRSFVNDGKSVATICVGTKVLIDTGMVKRKKMALGNAAEVVVDNGIVTSRCAEENKKFINKMIECFSTSPRATCP